MVTMPIPSHRVQVLGAIILTTIKAKYRWKVWTGMAHQQSPTA